ncbi:hypothetical protein [Nocardia nepalensis]|uniref:hypothetical protein n=1 Tax=Nocardia nepalensis TaxID=3375448 RepID=UPI003B67C6D5
MPLVVGVAALIAAWASVVAVSWGIALWPLVGGCVLAPVAVWCALVGARLSAARRVHESRCAREWSRFQAALERWHLQVAEHDRREQERVESTVLWHPVRPEHRWGQVNVFGGTVDGWSSLLATLGLSLLSDGAGLLVLDFTERGVASDLAGLARTAGFAVRVDRVPADGVVAVGGLSPAEAGELVSEVLAGVRGGQPDTVRARAVDAELIEAVTACLETPRTFERIAAGLALLRRTLDVEEQTCLSAQEVRKLSRVTEIVGSTSSAAEELRFLASSMQSLARLPTARLSIGSMWPQAGLRVIETAEANARRKDLLDRFAFFRMVNEVRATVSAPADAVVVAGADHLGAAELEVLARHAGRVGMRLIVMSEHLRGEQAQLLGAAGSAAVLMRLGHAGEAAAAADFVGRGHRFVWSQLTEQIGRSFTDGVSDTAGDSVTSTVTDNSSPTSAGSSDSRSRAMTWSQTTSWSWSRNSSTAHTWARAYEYVVEPTVFQSLPATAFVWVETGGRGRRVVAGDCNPGIALLDRVARGPQAGAAVVSC